MNPAELRQRTKEFAKRVVRFTRPALAAYDTRDVFRQLLRSGTSVGANYRSAQRSRSQAEFAARIGIVLEEADESLYWLELVDECNLSSSPERLSLLDESSQLVRIFTKSWQTASARKSGDRVIGKSSNRVIEQSGNRVIG